MVDRLQDSNRAPVGAELLLRAVYSKLLLRAVYSNFYYEQSTPNSYGGRPTLDIYCKQILFEPLL